MNASTLPNEPAIGHHLAFDRFRLANQRSHLDREMPLVDYGPLLSRRVGLA